MHLCNGSNQQAAFLRCIWPVKSTAEVSDGPSSESPNPEGWQGSPSLPGQCFVHSLLPSGTCRLGCGQQAGCRHRHSSPSEILKLTDAKLKRHPDKYQFHISHQHFHVQHSWDTFYYQAQSCFSFKTTQGTWTCSLSQALYSGHRLQGEVRKSLSKSPRQ